MRFHHIALIAALSAAASAARAQAPDFQWTFNASGTFDYTLTAVSSSQLFAGALPASDPTINLTIGKRYRVTNLNPAFHPFGVIAADPGVSGDGVLLAEGGAVGSMEADAGVAWTDDAAGTLTFTVTQPLLSAMKTLGRTPGYRCGLHGFTMRGAFNVQPPPFDFEWTFNDDGVTNYRLTFVSSSELFAGALPADDPTIRLQLGMRYRVNVFNPGFHPLSILAKGATAGADVTLLTQAGTTLPFESDPGVAWFDDEMGVVEFTLAPALLAAMSGAGFSPGYRCEIHQLDMRGDFAVLTGASAWERYE